MRSLSVWYIHKMHMSRAEMSLPCAGWIAGFNLSTERGDWSYACVFELSKIHLPEQGQGESVFAETGAAVPSPATLV
jgi:hypothetical protein